MGGEETKYKDDVSMMGAENSAMMIAGRELVTHGIVSWLPPRGTLVSGVHYRQPILDHLKIITTIFATVLRRRRFALHAPSFTRSLCSI